MMGRQAAAIPVKWPCNVRAHAPAPRLNATTASYPFTGTIRTRAPAYFMQCARAIFPGATSVLAVVVHCDNMNVSVDHMCAGSCRSRIPT